jgi:hypothetical protein
MWVGNLVSHNEKERKLRVFEKRLPRKEFWAKGRGNRGLKETAQ